MMNNGAGTATTGFAEHVLNDKPGRRVPTVPADALVLHAVRQMGYHKVGALVVTKGDIPIGIFSERDVLVRVIAQGRDPRTTWVAEVMPHDLITISPSTTTEEAMALMERHDCHHLPVLENGELRGLVSSTDLSKWVLNRQALRIEDLIRYITGH
jgi:CBS domain-containing protein